MAADDRSGILVEGMGRMGGQRMESNVRAGEEGWWASRLASGEGEIVWAKRENDKKSSCLCILVESKKIT